MRVDNSDHLKTVLKPIIENMFNKEEINKYQKELERLQSLIDELSMENEKLKKINNTLTSDPKINAKLKSYADQIEEVYDSKLKVDKENKKLQDKVWELQDTIFSMKNKERILEDKINNYKETIEQQKHDLDELRQFDQEKKNKKIIFGVSFYQRIKKCLL